MAAITGVVPAAAVTYDGEFHDGYLATENNFFSDFTEIADCTITNNVLGSRGSDCVYQSTIAWDATAQPSVNSRDWYFAWVADIDGPVRGMRVRFELTNNAASHLQAADDARIVEAAIYTHEENPRKVFDLTPYIKDGTEIDAKTGVLQEGEYVIFIKLRTLAISPDATSGDEIGLLRLRLDTSGDVKEAYVTLTSA
jgi:hypothetical protein